MMGYTTDCLPRVGLIAANSGKLVVTGFNINMPLRSSCQQSALGTALMLSVDQGTQCSMQGRGYHIYPRQCQRGEKGEEGSIAAYKRRLTIIYCYCYRYCCCCTPYSCSITRTASAVVAARSARPWPKAAMRHYPTSTHILFSHALPSFVHRWFAVFLTLLCLQSWNWLLDWATIMNHEF